MPGSYPSRRFWGLVVVGGGLGAFVGLPWLISHAWQIEIVWGRDGYFWLYLASVSIVAFIFAVNLFLRLLGSDALEVTLPPALAFTRRVTRAPVAWSAVIVIVIGLVIGETIFT
jgi:hypothetical protein